MLSSHLRQHLKRSLKILLAVIALVIVALIVAIIVPSLPSYRFASISEARAFSHIEDAEIVDELGDTNGPYRLKGGVVGGVGKPFDFDLTFNGHTINWSRPVSNHMWFVATIFENRRGNQFAVVRKRTE
jgi:phage shock protein PspC (stress-responsive transcriptional regulator)